MGSRSLLMSAVSVVVLSVTLAAPALAGAPTYSGDWTCVRVSDGDVIDLNPLSNDSKKVINEWKRFWVDNGQCERNSFDTSGLVQDP